MGANPLAEGLCSAFVPDFALQGQQLSAHVTWKPEVTLESLQITLPQGLALRHIYNVPRSALAQSASGKVTISGVTTPGYVGIVLESSRLPIPESVETVTIELATRAAGIRHLDRKVFPVRLFRPEIWVEAGARTIETRSSEGDGILRVDDPILVTNHGRGTGLVLIVPRDAPREMITDYMLQSKVRSSYMKVIEERFLKIASDMPQSEEYLTLWRRFFTTAGEPLNERQLDLLKDIADQSRHLELERPDLIEEVGEAIVDALLAVFTSDQRFSSWAQSMNATLENGVVLLNPSTALQLNAGETKLAFDVVPIDLLGHKFPPIPMGPITVVAKSEGILPLFELLSTGARESNRPHANRRLSGARQISGES